MMSTRQKKGFRFSFNFFSPPFLISHLRLTNVKARYNNWIGLSIGKPGLNSFATDIIVEDSTFSHNGLLGYNPNGIDGGIFRRLLVDNKNAWRWGPSWSSGG